MGYVSPPDVECPYCGKGQEINHDDGYGYTEGVFHEQRCGHCDKTFVYETSISFSYDAGKADCLNGSPHDWQTTCTVPIVFTQMRCKSCGQVRDLTIEERLKHGIPSREEYYNSLKTNSSA